MNQNIKIGETPLDLDSGTVISTTKRVANIGTLERQSSFTNKLNLPATAKNLAAIGMVQGNDNSTKKYVKQLGSVLSNGIEVMNTAQFSFESLSDRLEVLINSDNAIFYDAINKLNLRELDLSVLDHKWNKTEIVNSIGNVFSDGFIYTILNTGNQSISNNSVQCEGLIPLVFAKYLFDKIGLYFGYTFTGTFWNNSFFEKLLIPVIGCNVGGRNIYELQLQAIKNTNQSLGGVYNTFTRVTPYDTLLDPYYSTFTDKWGCWSTNKYVILIPGEYVFKLDFQSDIVKANPGDANNLVQASFRARCVQIIGGVSTILAEQTITQTTVGPFDNSITLNVSFDQFLTQTQAPEVFVYLEMSQRLDSSLPPPTYYNTLLTLDSAKITVVSINNAPVSHFNRLFNIQESLPEWTCGKLFKEVCNLAGVIPIVDEGKKEIRLMMINELNDNKPIAKNWQSKIDLANDVVYTFKIPGYAQKMNFQYLPDTLYGYSINVLNQSLPKEISYIKSEFNYTFYSRILGKTFNTVLINIWNSEISRIEFDDKPRILFLFTENTPVIYTAPNEGNTTQTTGIPFAGFHKQTFLSINLEWKYLYETFYRSLIQGITNNILKIELDFRLTEFDIQDFDFSIPVYLENPSGYYYVQEIKDFTSSKESTSVELLRIG
jgi:hypothetical protein